MHQNTSVFTGVNSIKSFQDLLDKKRLSQYSGIFILTDTNSRNHCLPVLMGRFRIPGKAIILEIEAGENNKNLQTCMRIWHELAVLGADRYSLLICLGGGVVCDLGGFVASAYQRGMDFIYLPTTLLAQVDAAIGGKSGVNLKKLKNYIGLFSAPKAVYVFTDFLRTLPHDELLSGYAEVLKHGMLSNEKSYRELVEQFPDANAVTSATEWSKVLARSIEIKTNVVKLDPYEKGLRKVLNLGHTVGHAFESHSFGRDKAPLLHGLAVAMGLIVELKLSVLLCGFPEKLASDITSYLLSVFPFYSFSSEDITVIVDLMKFDKKNKGGSIQLTLIKNLGDLVTDFTCSNEIIEKCLLEYLELG